MLKTRIFTAAFIAIFAFALLFLTTVEVFRTCISVLWMLASVEYARLAALGRKATVVLVVLVSATFLLLFNYWDALAELRLPMLAAACLTWCIMFLRLVTFRANTPPQFGYSILGFATAFVSLSFAWIGLVTLRDLEGGQWWILCLLIIVWAADIGAYFSGRQFGGAKLAREISPAKTWSGFTGGLIVAAAAALALTQLAPWYSIAPWHIVVLSAVTMIVSVGGDLFISLQKRTVGLKDTGAILPGHGGLLDRFDSLIAASPFFALGLMILDQ